jgi:hypothetical protein
MEVKVLLQGPDTVHPIVIAVPDDEDPIQRLSAAVSQNSAIVTIGTSSFRTDRVIAVTVQAPTMRDAW